MRPRSMRYCGGILLAVAAAFAQQPPGGNGAVIRSTTNLVQVRVVATDSKGNPIADLRREDFELRDNGRPQPVTLFVANRGGAASAKAPAAGANGTVDTSPGYALILLDWVNTKYVEQLAARDSAIKLLRRVQPRQRIALYLLGPDPGLLLDFTDDRDELIKVLEEVELEPDPPVAGRLTVEEQLFDLNRKVEDTAHAFATVATQLAHVPGRKSLIWVTAGFPMVVNGGVVRGARPAELVYVREIENLLAKLNTGDVAVYAIDACGLTVKACGFVGTMEELAGRTGGTVFADRNDLDEGMRLALDDLSVSYTLGFHAPEDAPEGLHEIRLRVNRPGVLLRYRESYRLVW